MQLALIYTLLLAWLAFIAWVVAWPLTWISPLVLICLGYIAYRIIYELTLNRLIIPTMATCFVGRQKTAKILQDNAALSLNKTYNIVDLGSGRGELARCIAKKIPTATVTGVEMARFPFIESCLIQRLLGPKNLSYERCDFWDFDCSTTNAVVLYLGPITAQKIGEKLHRELPEESIVISHTYPLLGNWTPTEILSYHAPFKETIFVYAAK